MKDSADVVVIGGGANGCAIAYNLAKEKIQTILVEKDCLCHGASGRCGAMIWSLWSDSSSKDLAEIGSITLERFAGLEEELDADLEYKTEDYVVLVFPGRETYFREIALNTKKNLGISLDFLKPADIKKMVPYIEVEKNQIVGGYYHYSHPAESSANPFLTVQALAANAEKLGAKIHTNTEVTGIDVKNGRVETVLTSRGKISTRIVVNAAGAWSADVARMAGVKIPTMPYSEEAVVTEPLDPLPYYPLCYETWCRQTKSGQIVTGEQKLPIQQPDYNSRTSAYFLARITWALRRLIPKLGGVNILRQWAGIEDVTPDELPILGEVEEVGGLILACGCQGYGFCLSQAMGKLISDLIAKREKHRGMEELNLNRFGKKYREYPGRWYASTHS